MSLASHLIGEPWLMTVAGTERVMRDAEARKGLKPGATAADVLVFNPRPEARIDDNGIAHIHVCGVIGHRLDWVDKALGNTDVCDVRREVDAVIAAAAQGIMLHVDSPGGAITGTVELADYLSQVELPIFSYSDSCIASAGYWIPCGGRQIWSSFSAEVGSIGIFFPWIDETLAWAQAGISFQPITNAEAIYKSAGHGPSLTDDQRANLQDKMDRIFALFQTFVCRQRPNIEMEAMQGQSFLGMDALAMGLIDNIGTLNEAYAALCFEAGVFPQDVDLGQALPITFRDATPVGAYSPDQSRESNGEFGSGGSEGANPKEPDDDEEEPEEEEEKEPSLSSDEQAFVDFYDGDNNPNSFWTADGGVESGALTQEEADRSEQLSDSIDNFEAGDTDTWPLSEDEKTTASDLKSFVGDFDKDDFSTYREDLSDKYEDMDDKASSVDESDPNTFPEHLKPEATRLAKEFDDAPKEDREQLASISKQQSGLVSKAENHFEDERDKIQKEARDDFKDKKAALKGLADKAKSAVKEQKDEYGKIESKARSKFDELKSKDNGARD
jgi:ClpP class serine protease